MQFMKPDQTVAHFHLREGDHVADFGAGSGHFTFEMAKAVGPSGRVFAVEIQKNLAEAIRLEARKRRFNNIEVVWGDLEHVRGVRLGSGAIHAGLLSNTLFQVQNKEQVLRDIARIIPKDGKLFIIDWADSFGGVGPQSSDIVPEMKARAIAEDAGFILERSFPAGAHHYGLAFRRG